MLKIVFKLTHLFYSVHHIKYLIKLVHLFCEEKMKRTSVLLNSSVHFSLIGQKKTSINVDLDEFLLQKHYSKSKFYYIQHPCKIIEV